VAEIENEDEFENDYDCGTIASKEKRAADTESYCPPGQPFAIEAPDNCLSGVSTREPRRPEGPVDCAKRIRAAWHFMAF
jgi:hypothetical protein